MPAIAARRGGICDMMLERSRLLTGVSPHQLSEISRQPSEMASGSGMTSGWRRAEAGTLSGFPRADGSRTGLAADSAEPPLAGSIHYLVQVVPPPLRHVGQPGFDQLEPVEEAQDIRTAAV